MYLFIFFIIINCDMSHVLEINYLILSYLILSYLILSYGLQYNKNISICTKKKQMQDEYMSTNQRNKEHFE